MPVRRFFPLIVPALLAACQRPEPLRPGTFKVSVSGAVNAEWRGQADFCGVPGTAGTILLLADSTDAGFLFRAPVLQAGVSRAVDARDPAVGERKLLIAELFLPDSLMAEPRVRSGSLRIASIDPMGSEGNFALTVQPSAAPRGEAEARALTLRGQFVAVPRENCPSPGL